LKRILARTLYTIRYDKGTSFTKLKGHRLHFLKTYFLGKIRIYALERNDSYGTKSRIYLRMENRKTLNHGLCKTFNISRPTAYKFIARFENDGIEGLKQQSKDPQKKPNSTKDEAVKNSLQLKEKHKLWGAKKIKRLLFNVCVCS
jgi:hypothetical protein